MPQLKPHAHENKSTDAQMYSCPYVHCHAYDSVHACCTFAKCNGRCNNFQQAAVVPILRTTHGTLNMTQNQTTSTNKMIMLLPETFGSSSWLAFCHPFSNLSQQAAAWKSFGSFSATTPLVSAPALPHH